MNRRTFLAASAALCLAGPALTQTRDFHQQPHRSAEPIEPQPAPAAIPDEELVVVAPAGPMSLKSR